MRLGLQALLALLPPGFVAAGRSRIIGVAVQAVAIIGPRAHALEPPSLQRLQPLPL